MPRIEYVPKRFRRPSRIVIQRANEIIAEYQAQGFVLTVRQLYYQFVSRDYMPNTMKDYKRLVSIINDARLAGLIDWLAIEDRTRGLASHPFWDTPSDILESAAAGFDVDRWALQDYRVEVWIEKEALDGVFAGICRELQVPHLCCRGYTSQSEAWRAARRLRAYQKNGQTPVILHFGDHDPSGIDMTRDIFERMAIFGVHMEVRRLALNMDQVREYDPPPNPAKEADSRFKAYFDEFGDESWELDALEPSMLVDLVRTNVEEFIDDALWEEADKEVQDGRRRLSLVAARWDEVTEWLGDE